MNGHPTLAMSLMTWCILANYMFNWLSLAITDDDEIKKLFENEVAYAYVL